MAMIHVVVLLERMVVIMGKVTFDDFECCLAVPARPFGKGSPWFEVELWK